MVHKRPVRKITEVADSKHLNWGCGSCNVREVDGREERSEGEKGRREGDGEKGFSDLATKTIAYGH